MRGITRSVLCFVLIAAMSAASAAETKAAVILNEVPVDYMGGAPGLETKRAMSGKLTITTKEIKFVGRSGEFTIDPKAVTALAGGEHAKRRMATAFVGTIILTPLFLFALIGKKKKDIVLVEYCDPAAEVADGEEPELVGAAVFRYRHKGGRNIAIENALERVTKKTIVKDDVGDKTK